MQNVLVFIVFSLLIIVGVTALQIFLSKSKNKWLGLILPVVCLMFSVIAMLNVAAYTELTTSYVETIEESGAVIARKVVNNPVRQQNIEVPSVIFTMLIVFIYSNIPTIILLAIYFACREKLKKNKEIDKMNIQDLS